MSRLILLYLLVLVSPLSWGMDLYGGLTELFSYESSLPCHSKTSNCSATNGVLGYALDQANEAGLEISTVIEKQHKKEDSEVFVTTKNYGVCKVETKNLQQLGSLGFLCSSVAQANTNLEKIDRVLTLTKKEDSYALLDITNNTRTKVGL